MSLLVEPESPRDGTPLPPGNRVLQHERHQPQRPDRARRYQGVMPHRAPPRANAEMQKCNGFIEFKQK